MKPIIICVLRSGPRYDVRYVRALRVACKKYFPEDHEFWCLTNVPEAIMAADAADLAIRQSHNWPGWWIKMELFNVIPEGRRVIYFDLDVLILNDLTVFYESIKNHGGVLMLRDSLPLAIKGNLLSNSIMTWTGLELRYIYDEFLKAPNAAMSKFTPIRSDGTIGDQGFMRQFMNPDKFQDFLPKHYIVDKQEYSSNLLKTASILNWHGKPRFDEMTVRYNEVFNIWKSYGI